MNDFKRNLTENSVAEKQRKKKKRKGETEREKMRTRQSQMCAWNSTTQDQNESLNKKKEPVTVCEILNKKNGGISHKVQLK